MCLHTSLPELNTPFVTVFFPGPHLGLITGYSKLCAQELLLMVLRTLDAVLRIEPKYPTCKGQAKSAAPGSEAALLVEAHKLKV